MNEENQMLDFKVKRNQKGSLLLMIILTSLSYHLFSNPAIQAFLIFIISFLFSVVSLSRQHKLGKEIGIAKGLLSFLTCIGIVIFSIILSTILLTLSSTGFDAKESLNTSIGQLPNIIAILIFWVPMGLIGALILPLFFKKQVSGEF